MKISKPLFPMLALLTAFALGLFLTGCSSTTSSNPPSAPVTPKVGSTYTYAQHRRDSTGTNPATVTDSVIIVTVVSTGGHVAGMNNVITTVESNGDTVLYTFNANGDMMIYEPQIGTTLFTLQIPTPWLRLPCTSKDTGVVVLTMDTSVTIGGFPVAVHTAGVSSYVGTDQLTGAGSKTLTGGNAKLTVTITATIPFVGTKVAVGTQAQAMDPTIGQYFHQVSTVSTPAVQSLAATGSISERWLTAFTLK